MYIYAYICLCVGVHVCHSEHAEVRGQLVGASSIIPPCGLWGLNSGHIYYIWTCTYILIHSVVSVPLENHDYYIVLRNNVHRLDIKKLWCNGAKQSHEADVIEQMRLRNCGGKMKIQNSSSTLNCCRPGWGQGRQKWHHCLCLDSGGQGECFYLVTFVSGDTFWLWQMRKSLFMVPRE